MEGNVFQLLHICHRINLPFASGKDHQCGSQRLSHSLVPRVFTWKSQIQLICLWQGITEHFLMEFCKRYKRPILLLLLLVKWPDSGAGDGGSGVKGRVGIWVLFVALCICVGPSGYYRTRADLLKKGFAVNTLQSLPSLINGFHVEVCECMLGDEKKHTRKFLFLDLEKARFWLSVKSAFLFFPPEAAILF